MKTTPVFTALRLTTLAATALLGCAVAVAAEDANEGQALLAGKCSQCHAVTADGKSRLSNAPNLWDKLRAYPIERLDFELAEGIGSRHPVMPQIQFTDEQITAIIYYLHPEANPQE